MTAFATVGELEASWRALSAEEESRAAILLDRASRKIRARWPTVDARIALGTLDPYAVGDVVLEMVQNAMSVPYTGVSSMSQTTGPYAENVAFANPQGALYFTAEMIRLLEPPGTGGAVGSIKLTRA